MGYKKQPYKLNQEVDIISNHGNKATTGIIVYMYHTEKTGWVYMVMYINKGVKNYAERTKLRLDKYYMMFRD